MGAKKPADDEDELSYEIAQLFGSNRKLRPGDRNLISLFWKGLDGGPKRGEVKPGSRHVMIMAVDLTKFEVLEQAVVTADWNDERWRHWFQWMFVNEFGAIVDEVARAAFGDYMEGQTDMHKLSMRHDNLYKHLDEDGQKDSREKLRKKLNRLKQKAKAAKGAARGSKGKRGVSQKSRSGVQSVAK